MCDSGCNSAECQYDGGDCPTPAPTNTPSPTPEGYEPEYYQISTGTCPPVELITNNALCESAATFLNLSDTTVSTTSYTYSRPLGCVYFTDLGSTGLYMQTAGSSPCTKEINCICMQPTHLASGTTTPLPTPDPSLDHRERKPRLACWM